MPERTTTDRVAEIIGDRLARDWRTLRPETNLTVDLGADSLDLAEIAMDLEDAFGLRMFSITDDDMPKTVGEIAALIDKLKAA